MTDFNTPANLASGATITETWVDAVRDSILHLDEAAVRSFTSQAGITHAAGAVFVKTSDTEADTTTTIGDSRPVLVNLASLAAAATGRMRVMGLVTVLVQGTVAVADALQTSATAGRAQTGTTNPFAIALTANPSGSGQVLAAMAPLKAAQGAPTDATYIVQTANGALSAEQVLASLATGLMKVTNGTGVISTATASDLPAHDHDGSTSGGKLTNDAHDGYSVYEEIAAPSAPAADTTRLYAKDVAGTTELFYKNSAGTERDLSAGAAGLTAHNHTAGGGDGGVLTDDEHDGFSEYAEIAAPSTPAAGKVRLYAKTDGLLYSKDDAGAEVVVSGGGGSGGETLITDTTADGTVGTYTFSSIPGTYQHLRLRVWGRGDQAGAANQELRLRMNGDTGSNYQDQRVIEFGTTRTAARQETTYTNLGFLPTATATASYPGHYDVLIPNYVETAFFHSFSCYGGYSTATGDLAVIVTLWGHWRSTSAITSLTVFMQAGNFLTGTRLQLYGVG